MEPPTLQEDIDDITLELLLNKSKYDKILSKTNPAKFKERQLYLQRIHEKSSSIKTIFQELLDNPHACITKDISEGFDHFVRSCLKHLEILELDHLKYDPTLFGNCDDSGENRILSSSSWGRSNLSYLES
jgi:hypothetical protein